MLEVDFEEVTQEMSSFNTQKAASLVSDAAKSLQNSIPVLPVVSMPDFGLPPLDSLWSSPVIPSADEDPEATISGDGSASKKDNDKKLTFRLPQGQATRGDEKSLRYLGTAI